MIGLLAFRMHDVMGVVRVRDLVSTLLAGRVVPLALFPPALKGLVTVQPFRYTLSFPLEVVTGRLAPPDIARGFARQIGYCLALYLCYRLIWRRGICSYSAAGA